MSTGNEVKWRVLAAAIVYGLIAGLAAPELRAEPLFGATAFISGGGELTQVTQSGAGPVAESISGGSVGRIGASRFGAATASAGLLGAVGSTQASVINEFALDAAVLGAGATAIALHDDLIISSPSLSSEPVDGALRLFLHVRSFLSDASNTLTRSQVRFSAQFSNAGSAQFTAFPGFPFFDGAATLDDTGPGDPTFGTNMFHLGVTSAEILEAGIILQIPFENLPVNVPFGLHLQLSSSALVFTPGSDLLNPVTFSGMARADAFDTFGFPTNGVVFELPSGYTVNSESARIFDNAYVGTAQIPEPKTLMLLALALFLAVWMTPAAACRRAGSCQGVFGRLGQLSRKEAPQLGEKFLRAFLGNEVTAR